MQQVNGAEKKLEVCLHLEHIEEKSAEMKKERSSPDSNNKRSISSEKRSEKSRKSSSISTEARKKADKKYSFDASEYDVIDDVFAPSADVTRDAEEASKMQRITARWERHATDSVTSPRHNNNKRSDWPEVAATSGGSASRRSTLRGGPVMAAVNFFNNISQTFQKSRHASSSTPVTGATKRNAKKSAFDLNTM